MTEKDLIGLTLLGSFNNNWRGRFVRVYQHPTNPDLVISWGRAFDTGEDVIVEESRERYARRIDNSDWSDYN